MDLAFDDMHGESMILLRKKCFLAVNPSLRWLTNVRGAYLVQGSLLLIGQKVWDISSCFDPCFPLAGLGLCKLLTPDEMTNTNPSRETVSLKGRFLKIKLVGAHCSGWGYSAPTPSSWQRANLPSSQPFQGSITHASKPIIFSYQKCLFNSIDVGKLAKFRQFRRKFAKLCFAKCVCLLKFSRKCLFPRKSSWKLS